MATTTTVTIERTGPAIRAALVEHAPQDAARFESELRDALSHATADLDLAASTPSWPAGTPSPRWPPTPSPTTSTHS